MRPLYLVWKRRGLHVGLMGEYTAEMLVFLAKAIDPDDHWIEPSDGGPGNPVAGPPDWWYLPHFRCPRCQAVSYHPKDIEYGYCGRCHVFTRDLSPLNA